MGGRSPLRPLLLRSGLLASRALQKCTAEAAVSARIGSRLPAREKRNLKNAIAATLANAQALVVALALAPAAAFVGPAPAAPSTALKESLSDLKALQQALPGPPNDYFDPLNLATMTFDWGPQGEEATIGWLRHSEIKHGRVAMAGFLGFIAHCTPLVSGEHKFLPYRGYVAGVTPQEQWDNIPLYGKLQILVAIGMLESYGEGAGDPEGYTHYMKGGKPGYYPPIAGRAGFGQVTLNLWDPFNLVQNNSAEKKARGLKSEILNGRAAMVGLMGLLSASSVPGSVPFLAGIEGFPQYSGNVMIPFSNDFSLFA